MPSKACKFRGNYRYKKDRGVLLEQKWNVSYGVRTLPSTVLCLLERNNIIGPFFVTDSAVKNRGGSAETAETGSCIVGT